jgi:hypothetical protein
MLDYEQIMRETEEFLKSITGSRKYLAGEGSQIVLGGLAAQALIFPSLEIIAAALFAAYELGRRDQDQENAFGGE